MRRRLLTLAAIAVLLSFGCAKRAVHPAQPPSGAPPARREAPPPREPPEEPTQKPVPPLEPPPPAAAPGDAAYAAGAAAMKEANYERALESLAAAWNESPGHPGVARDFPDALTALKNRGDESFRQGRMEEAGRRWSAALRYMSHPAEKAKPTVFSKADLIAGIDRISAGLMEKGLVEYRRGDLEAAIASWKSILAFNPSHEEAARAVQTATTQLENLKRIAPPK